ncbi:unnamed protein product, partial [Phaeothamnion confervicola]
MRVVHVFILVQYASMPLLFAGATAAAASSTGAAEEPPVSISSLRSSAENALTKGEHDEALALFSRVCELEPMNERNYYKRFRVYLTKRRYKDAISDLTKALDIKPGYKQALAQRAKLLRMVGDCSASVADYAALQQLDPGNKDMGEGIPLSQACKDALQQAEKSKRRRDWVKARDLYEAAIEHTAAAPALLMEKARCSWHL